MKRTIVLVGASLIMIFLCGVKTEVYGQACCASGTYGYHTYYSNGICEESQTQYCGYDECVVCDYYEFLQCIYNGDSWNPYSCSCTMNCSNNSSQAQSCNAMAGMIWNSSTCTCEQDPWYYHDPCEFARPGGTYNDCDFTGYFCEDCHYACGYYYCASNTYYYGDNGEFCYSVGSSWTDWECFNTSWNECTFMCEYCW